MKKAEIPVSVCHWNGDTKRFFGKFRDDDEPRSRRKWKKIPGGPFPPEVNTKEKALACARKWYLAEMAERRLQQKPVAMTATWPALCDEFCEDVKKRLRGADASKDEAQRRSTFLRRSVLLCSRPVGEHDDTLAIAWVREILAEPLGRKGREGETRDALTVRNVARVLDGIYKFAQARGYLPKNMRRPTEADEFRAEIAGALKEKSKLGLEGRVACPTETVRALVHCAAVPELRRVMTRVAFFTGARPGELHAWRVSDYRELFGVRFMDVREQWTLAKKDYPSRLAPLKTVWCRRKIPVHASLVPCLDAWLSEGWKRHVGRAPTSEDFLFPNANGQPFREESSQEFLADLRAAGSDTTHKGHMLDVYGLRHSFATIAKRAKIFSDARDRLLGHRPKDVKGMFYEDEDVLLPLLAEEIAKLPALLDDESSSVEASSTITPAEPLSNPSDLVPVLVRTPANGPGAISNSLMISAEEEGFEPTVAFRLRRFSKPVP
jgi:integrase